MGTVSYGVIMWDKTADIKAIFVLQKREIRAIYKIKSRETLIMLKKLSVISQFVYANLRCKK